VNTRERILEAAQALFATQGYRRTGTAQIAEAAGIVESTLFRHFNTKAQLFEQAVIAPLRTSVDDLTARRRQADPDVSNEEAAYNFFDEILTTLRRDSGLLIAALAALTFESETDEFHRLPGAFSDLLAYMDEVMTTRAAERGFAVDPQIGSRALLAVALGCTLGEQLLFDATNRPSHEHLARELAKITAFGVPGRPLTSA
jgi:AcrR family transcriptional regulator